ncbi:MAG: hypothetical protein HUU38_16865 [Anaerolineales bacterium]|nr:hypothetical protein [Anaerolineales bacterium]
MKIFSNPWIGVLSFLIGLLSLFLPHLSGWSEIVYPSLAEHLLLPYFFWLPIFGLMLLLLLFHTYTTIKSPNSQKHKMTAGILSAGMIVLFFAVNPTIFFTGEVQNTQQRIAFFAVGAQTRLTRAGGMEVIKQDALELLHQETDNEGYVNDEIWTDALQKLGAMAIRTNPATESVIVYIPKAHIFDPDQFGYLITNRPPHPDILFAKNGYRLWELGEGVYFFEIW